MDADLTPAGNDPMQTTTAWLDRFFGMVRHVTQLVRFIFSLTRNVL